MTLSILPNSLRGSCKAGDIKRSNLLVASVLDDDNDYEGDYYDPDAQPTDKA